MKVKILLVFITNTVKVMAGFTLTSLSNKWLSEFDLKTLNYFQINILTSFFINFHSESMSELITE